MVRRNGVLGVLFGVVAVSAASADEELDKLTAAYAAAVQSLSEQIKKLETESQPVDVDKLPHPDREFYPQFRAHAEKHAGQPAALPALTWLLENNNWITDGERRQVELRWVVDRLGSDHAADPNIKDAMDSLSWLSEPAVRDIVQPLYERVVKDNPDAGAKASAAFNIAKTDYVCRVVSDGAGARSEVVGDVKRARELFGQVVREYPDTEAAERAAGYIFELDHLQIGMKAPDFAGTDVAEREIKLSDFRGRVVVVAFWGYW
jgi:hypothetical protein